MNRGSSTPNHSGSPVRCALWAAVLMALVGGVLGCKPTLPEDPAERLAEVRRLIDESPTSIQAAVWVGQLADDVRAETRDFFFEILETGHPQLIVSPLLIMDDERWLDDAELRRRLVEFFLDENRGAIRRRRVRHHVLAKWAEHYEEFRDLPPEPPPHPGIARVEPRS